MLERSYPIERVALHSKYAGCLMGGKQSLLTSCSFDFLRRVSHNPWCLSPSDCSTPHTSRIRSASTLSNPIWTCSFALPWIQFGPRFLWIRPRRCASGGKRKTRDESFRVTWAFWCMLGRVTALLRENMQLKPCTSRSQQAATNGIYEVN